MLDPVTVPVGLATVQTSPTCVGWPRTVTSYADPLGTDIANVKGPFAPKNALPTPLTPEPRSTMPGEARPLMVPPSVNETVEHVTATVVTLELAVPAPFESAQFWLIGKTGSCTITTD